MYTLRAVDPSGTQAGFLPAVDNVKINITFSDIGSGEFEYAVKGANANLVAEQREVAVIGPDGVEINDTRFIVEGSNGQRYAPEGVLMRKWSGRSLWKMFDESLVYVATWPTDAGTGKASFGTGTTAGTILSTLINRAQSLGELPGITYDFTSTQDSGGHAWAYTLGIEYDMGVSLLSVLQNLVDQGLIEVRLRGRLLQVYNINTLGTDRSTGSTPVILWASRNVLEAPEQRESAGLRTVALVKGDDGVFIEVEDSTAKATYGRRTMFVSQGGVKDSGTLQVVGNANLGRSSKVRSELTYKYKAGDSAPVPMVNFFPGDWVLTDITGAMQSVRVRQILIEWGSDNDVIYTIVLNDKFLENEILLNRRVEGISGGATVSGGSPAVPATQKPDKVAPGQVAGLTLSSDAYTDDQGHTFGQVSASWLVPSVDALGNALDDLDHYEVQWRYSSTESTYKRAPLVTGNNSLTWSPLNPGVNVTVRVRGVDQAGNKGNWSTEQAVVTADDTTPPPQPSTPVTSNYLGGVVLTWDGLGSAGEQMPGDFQGLRVVYSTVNDFDPAAGTVSQVITVKNHSVSITVQGLDYGVEYFFKLVAVDQSGNESTPSAQSSAIPQRASGIDIANGSVGFDQIAFKQPGNLVQDGSFEDDTYRAAVMSAGVTGAPTFSFINDGTASLGNWFLRATPGATSTYRDVNLILPDSTSSNAPVAGYLPCQPGERYLFRMMARQTGANGSLNLGARVIDKTGASLNSANVNYYQVTAASIGSAFGLKSWVLTIPSGGAWMQPFIEVRPDASAGTWDFDQVELRPIIGTALIDDLAVTNAKINDLAVDKLITGQIAVGQKILAGPSSTTHAEMSSDGFRVFADDPIDNIPNEVVRMGTSSNDYFAISDSNGVPVASIDEDGKSSFSGLDVANINDIYFGGNSFVGVYGDTDQWDDVQYYQDGRDLVAEPFGYMERFGRGVVAYANVSTNTLDTLSGGGEIGWFEIRATLKPWRAYALRISPIMVNVNCTGQLSYALRTRYTTDGTSPTLSSTILTQVYASAAAAMSSGWFTFNIPYRAIESGSTDVDFRILVGLYATSANNVTANPYDSQGIYCIIEDIGPRMSGTFTVRNIGGGAPAPAPAPKQYVKTYSAVSSATYQGDGSKRTDTTDIVQGYNSYNGDGEGIACFPSMTTDLSGATVNKVEVYAYANHWYYNSGGTALIKVHGYSSPPASNPSQTTAVSSANWPKPGARWVTLPSSFYAGFKSGSYKGFGFGPAGTTNLLYYGRFNGANQSYEPKIRVTYTK